MSLEFFLANTIKCLNAEIILHGIRCVELTDSRSIITLLSWSTYDKLCKPGFVQTYTKRMLTANSSAVKVFGRVTLMVQLEPVLPEVEQEFVITAVEGLECLARFDYLKANKAVLKLHDENFYISQFKISITLATEKKQGVQMFVIAGENIFKKSGNECLMRIKIADECEEEIPGVERLLYANQYFGLNTGLLLAAFLISMNDDSSLIRV